MDKIIIVFFILIPKSHGLLVNLAHNKRVYMSSLYYINFGANAVDGNIDKRVALVGMKDIAAWIIVDLGRPYVVEFILLHNRYCLNCEHRMNKFYVGLLNDFDPNIKKDWTKHYSALGTHNRYTKEGEVVKVQNSNTLNHYRYVIIHKDPGNLNLALREFEIYGNYINYIGCYEDLENSVEAGMHMQLMECINKCDQLNNSYAGLKNGKQCICGDDVKQSRPLIECDIFCSNGLDYCGGSKLISAYNVSPLKGGMRLGIKYIDCFKDQDPRESNISSGNSNTMTIEFCQHFCLKKYYLYFGLQNGTVCSCSNTYSLYGQSEASECNMPCSGNKMQICGGTNRNSIYSINKEEDGLNFSRISYHCKDGVDLEIEGPCKNKQCEDGWAGDSCSMRDCSTNNGNCENHMCERASAFSAHVSECVCKDGYSKPAWWEPCNVTDRIITETTEGSIPTPPSRPPPVVKKKKSLKSTQIIAIAVASLLASIICCFLTGYCSGSESDSDEDSD